MGICTISPSIASADEVAFYSIAGQGQFDCIGYNNCTQLTVGGSFSYDFTTGMVVGPWTFGGGGFFAGGTGAASGANGSGPGDFQMCLQDLCRDYVVGSMDLHTGAGSLTVGQYLDIANNYVDGGMSLDFYDFNNGGGSVWDYDMDLGRGISFSFTATTNASELPEPQPWILLASGILLLLGIAIRRRLGILRCP